jgi:hypothetical protein
VPIIKKPVQRQALQKVFVPPDAEEPARLANRRYGARENLSRAAAGGT